MDVPVANFYFEYYEVVVVYMSKDYIGSKVRGTKLQYSTLQ